MKPNVIEKTLLVGRKAVYGNKRESDVELDLRLSYKESCAPHLSIDLEPCQFITEVAICGSVWLPSRKDIMSGGQNIEEIASLFPDNARAQRILAIWQRWHLNGVQAGTRLQQEALKSMEGRYEYDKACKHLEACGLLVDRGYRYGTAWLCEACPDEVVNELLALFGVAEA